MISFYVTFPVRFSSATSSGLTNIPLEISTLNDILQPVFSHNCCEGKSVSINHRISLKLRKHWTICKRRYTDYKLQISKVRTKLNNLLVYIYTFVLIMKFERKLCLVNFILLFAKNIKTKKYVFFYWILKLLKI